MTTRKDGTLLRQLDALFNVGVIRQWTDGQLLERFATGTGEAAELAFAALVERHGPMVLRVCRAQLVDAQDAQDAFQATFLILVEKARGLWVRDSLGPWLHQVAFRTATCAHAAAARRRRHERRAAELERPEGRADPELEQRLHAEIDRLPERYRVPIVLCDLQGLTCEEAARRMGRPVGTVKCWRARGRDRLRDRLTRLGLAPSAGLVVALSADTARAAVPGPDAEQTVRFAARILTDRATAGEVPASVLRLARGVSKVMLLSKLRTTAATILALGFLAAGLAAVAQIGSGGAKDDGDDLRGEVPPVASARPSRPKRPPLEESREIWSLSLRDAISIGLDNAEGVRLLKLPASGASGGGFVIAPTGADADVQGFRAEVMAHVRSIEQQYWSLAQQHVQLWSSEKAVELAEEIKKREESELEVGRGTVADVAEATQRLEQFRLDLVTKTSDVITTERQLRNILGLPPADNRRIVPATPPTEARVEPDRDACRAAMLENHPDILRGKAAVKEDGTREGRVRAERLRASLPKIVDRATRSLDRYLLEVDAQYKQLQTASRLRADAARRLEVERAPYEEGRIPVDRYLDAVSQYTGAVGQEAQFKTSYNITLVAVEEATGTLLASERITVADGPTPSRVAVARREGGKTPVPPGPANPAPLATPARLDIPAPRAKDGEATVEGTQADPAGKTFSFRFSVGIGPRPVEVRGSFTITPARSADAPKAP